MRYAYTVFFTFFITLLMIGMVHQHQQYRLKEIQSQIELRRKITRKIGLPDLAITTAARYLRHYSLTDINSPFQDYPVSLDHFPAGFAYSAPDFENLPVIFRLHSRTKNNFDEH